MATLGDLYNDLKTLCEQWFYNKTTADGRFSAIGHNHGNLSSDGKVGSNANYFVYTTTGGAVTSKQKIGNINTDGKIGSTANLPLITGSNGVVTTGSFGTSANSFCQGNDSRLSDARTPTSHNQATTTITNDQAYNNIKTGESTTLTLTTQKLINDAINNALGGKAPSTHTHTSSEINDGGSYTNFTPSDSTQSQINKAIDIAIGNLSSIKALEFVTTLPTASASTMGMLYVINESQKINFYWTYDRGESYNPRYFWEKMDTDILDELVVRASDVTDENAHSNIGSSANATQGTINGLIDSVLATKITKSNSATGLLKDDGTVMTSGTGSTNWAVGNHSHNYLTSDGKITQTITNNGNLVVTNSSNQVGVQSAIDVLDGVVNQLITYGSS